MSNLQPRFTLSVMRTEQPFYDHRNKKIKVRPKHYYLIGVNKDDGCRGTLLSLYELKRNLENGNVRTSSYAHRNMIDIILNSFRPKDKFEYVGAFRTIQDIVNTIEVLQL